MAIDASELLARVCAIEVEALNALTPPIASTAAPRWLYQQEACPYWRNRIVSVQLITDALDDGQEVDTYRYTVGAALHYANVSAGYDGEKDEDILAIVPQLIQYFDERELLQSASYLTPMAFLRLSYFQAGEGYVTFPYGAAGGVQIGPTFTYTCIFDRLITQAY